jgi:hypothetical protein
VSARFAGSPPAAWTRTAVFHSGQTWTGWDPSRAWHSCAHPYAGSVRYRQNADAARAKFRIEDRRGPVTDRRSPSHSSSIRAPQARGNASQCPVDARTAASSCAIVAPARFPGQLLHPPPVQHRRQDLLLRAQQRRPARQLQRRSPRCLPVPPHPVTLRRLHQEKESFTR